MANLIVTFNIDNASNRPDFVSKFETILTDLGLNKQQTNQSTYFGNYHQTK